MNELCNIRCIVLNYYDLGMLQSWFEVLRDFGWLPGLYGLKSGNLNARSIISILQLLKFGRFYDKGPRSWSPPLCRLVLWNRVLEPSLNIHVIYICNFRLCVYTFLLVFFNLLAGTAFLARSIKLCLVDNQRSSGVTVAGFESCWLEAGSRTSSSPQSNLSTTSRKIGHGVINWYQISQVYREV